MHTDIDAQTRSNARLHLILLLLLVVVTTLQVPLTQPVTDPFQEAEYATFGFLARTQPDFAMPILIHGGLDVIPSRIAALVCHSDTQIVCVRTINAFIQLGSAGMLVAVLATLAGLGTRAALLASLPTAAILWLYNGTTIRIIDAHQGTPGVRDLFVMASLLLMARQCCRLDRGEMGGGSPSLLALGGLTGIGLFWAYNRGLALVLIAGTFSIGLCLFRRSPLPALLMATGALAGLAAVLAAGGVEFISDTIFNIVYWGQHEAIWHKPLDLGILTSAIVLTTIALTGALQVVRESLRSEHPGRALIIITLIVTYVLYAVQSLNRPDPPHLRWVMWPATLIMAIILRAWFERTNDASPRAGGETLAILLLLTGACVETYSDRSIVSTVFTGLVNNTLAATRATPTDRTLVGEDMARIADAVAASGRCTFAANNAGIIYLLSRMPPCSRFAFGTYVAPDRQVEVIAELQATRPEVIIWESHTPWSDIDYRGFRDRTPILADWIEAHYPVRTTFGQHAVLSRAALPR